MKIQAWIISISVLLEIIFFLTLTDLSWKLQQFQENTVDSISVDNVVVQITIYGILFGIFLNWREISLIITGRVSFNWFPAVISVLLLVLVFIPYHNWISWYGVQTNSWISFIMESILARILISVFTGILFVRSFVNN
ncbi:hypothetical protein MUB24_13180 [Lederbergia sp. NSJ-179]|uniref:hypothetical protein n=1 Tax=Lederbergia sp. NSJ-179 TaxID=2931402 RepID=UPI001FD0D8B8|nr:hypothetical protein [Lederbergia sp. NSJ-179]MCJ7841834.1 hypothetical protein [Lederbergia sp. NSJ-179]